MIGLYTLGAVDLLDRSGGHQVLSVLAQPKRVAFLTYLAVTTPRGLQSRDTLLGVFWPDSSEKKARNALNQTVFVLRRALGQETLAANGESGVGVGPSHLWCDVWEFEQALGAGEKEEALELYKGSFLEGFFLPGCLEFERWADAERSRLRDLATGAVLSLSQEMETAGNPVGAVGWLRRAREWAVYDELILRRQVELLMALGDRSGAIREYESFARRLSVDLGMEPSEDARRLLEAPPQPFRPRGGPEGADDSLSRTVHPPIDPPPDRKRRFSLSQTALVVLLAAAAGAGGALAAPSLWTSKTPTVNPIPPTPDGTKTVAVLPFENATDHPDLDPIGWEAADRIIEELARIGRVWIRQIHRDERTSGTAGAKLDGAQAGMLGGRPLDETDYLVSGSFSVTDGEMAFRGRIIEAESGDIIAVFDKVTAALEDPEAGVERLSRRVAGTMAMFMDSRLSALVGVVSHPPDFETYQLVSDGLDLERRSFQAEYQDESSLQLLNASRETFLRAVDPDTTFTLPLLLSLDVTLPSSPQFGSTVDALLQRRGQLPPWERAMADGYEASISKDKRAGYEAVRRVYDLVPSLAEALHLAGSALSLNRPREALGWLDRLDSEADSVRHVTSYWVTRIDAQMALGEYEAALADSRYAWENETQGISLIPREIEALARLGRAEEAVERSIQHLEAHPGQEEHALWTWLPGVLRGTGLSEEARQVAEVSVAKLRELERSRGLAFPNALMLAGRYDEARQALVEIEDEAWFSYRRPTILAYMAAKEGYPEEAIRQSQAARDISDAEVQSRTNYGVMSQIEVAAQLGDLGRAVRLLREAFDLGIPEGPWALTRWDLTPLYGYEPFEELMRPKG
jgi:DNA-binding SARP family transcriptional activator